MKHGQNTDTKKSVNPCFVRPFQLERASVAKSSVQTTPSRLYHFFASVVFVSFASFVVSSSS